MSWVLRNSAIVRPIGRPSHPSSPLWVISGPNRPGTFVTAHAFRSARGSVPTEIRTGST